MGLGLIVGPGLKLADFPLTLKHFIFFYFYVFLHHLISSSRLWVLLFTGKTEVQIGLKT